MSFGVCEGEGIDKQGGRQLFSCVDLGFGCLFEGEIWVGGVQLGWGGDDGEEGLRCW